MIGDADNPSDSQERLAVNAEMLIEQIESVLGETAEGVPILNIRRQEPEGDAVWFEKIARLSSAIERIAPPRSAYRRLCEEVLRFHAPPTNSRQTAERLKAILLGLKEDIAERALTSNEEMIHADVLSDLLDMADRMLADGFKDPAAILAGSILAEHMRRLMIKNQIPRDKIVDGNMIPKNVDDMNRDLVDVTVYTKSDQRCIHEWNQIRKSALVGDRAEYSGEQTRNMISGIRLLINRMPA